MYKGHKQKGAGFYLKSRSEVVRLISYLPKFNKGIKDDYLIASGAWHDGLPCPTQPGEPSGNTLDLGFLTLDLSYLSSALFYYIFFMCTFFFNFTMDSKFLTVQFFLV